MVDLATFAIEMDVRDYECDMQGIVNNAVYMNYLEHARHSYLLSTGTDFAELCKHGIYLVVTRAEIEYKKSLRSGDRFVVFSTVQQQGKVRFCFDQQIKRGAELIVAAKISGAAIGADGRPQRASVSSYLGGSR